MNLENIQKVRIKVGVIVVAGMMCLGFADDPNWKRTWSNIPESQAKKIFADLTNENSFWIATSRSLYHMDDSKALSVIAHKKVNWVYQDPANEGDVYLAADDGLFVSDKESGLRTILGKHGCLTVTSLGKQVFAGTAQGLFVRDDPNGLGIA